MAFSARPGMEVHIPAAGNVQNQQFPSSVHPDAHLRFRPGSLSDRGFLPLSLSYQTRRGRCSIPESAEAGIQVTAAGKGSDEPGMGVSKMALNVQVP